MLPQLSVLADEIDLGVFFMQKDSYVRHILSTQDGYHLMLVRWDKGAKTVIHGHPWQMFVYLLFGELLIENYDNASLSTINETICQPDDYYIHHGDANRLDNAIHRVIVKKPSLSLHFYSDDPQKGVVFD